MRVFPVLQMALEAANANPRQTKPKPAAEEGKGGARRKGDKGGDKGGKGAATPAPPRTPPAGPNQQPPPAALASARQDPLPT